MDHSAVPRLGDPFERHPVLFGLRGALFLWDALRTEFASAPLPSSWLQLRSILIEAIQRRIGRPLHAEATRLRCTSTVRLRSRLSAGRVDLT